MAQLYNASKQTKHSAKDLQEMSLVLKQSFPSLNSAALLTAANNILSAYTPPTTTTAAPSVNIDDNILNKPTDNTYEDCVQRLQANGVETPNATQICGDAYNKKPSVNWSRPSGVPKYVQPAQPVTTPTAPSGAATKSASIETPAWKILNDYHVLGHVEELPDSDSIRNASATDGGGEPAWLQLYNTRPGTHARGMEKAEANAVRERKIRSGSVDNDKPSWVVCMERFLDN